LTPETNQYFVERFFIHPPQVANTTQSHQYVQQKILDLSRNIEFGLTSGTSDGDKGIANDDDSFSGGETIYSTRWRNTKVRIFSIHFPDPYFSLAKDIF